MKRNKRSAAICIVICLLFIGIIFSIMPTSSALYPILSKAYQCQGHIRIDYDTDATQELFLPVDMIMVIPINVSYFVTGYYADDILPYYDVGAYVYLSVNETPEWASATILPSFFEIFPTTDWSSKESASLSIKVDDDSHAYSEGTIRLKAKLDGLGAVKGGIFYQDIPFKPGYLPILDIETEDTNYELIGPQDTAKFNIQIENLGNAKTEVLCKALNVPEGWTVIIEPSIVVGSKATGDNTKSTVSLVVKPPYNFGYHNEREVIQVSLTPSYFAEMSLTGKEYLTSFIVQSRGFSTPGFEAILVIMAIISVTILFGQRQKTINSKNKRPKGGKNHEAS